MPAAIWLGKKVKQVLMPIHVVSQFEEKTLWKADRTLLFQHLFKLIYLRSIAKQVIPTYINHSRPLIPDGIHLFFERGLRGERSQTCPYMLSAKQGSIWYHFYKVFGMTRSGIEPTTSRSRGERSNHWATAAVNIFSTYDLDLWYTDLKKWGLYQPNVVIDLWHANGESHC